MAGFRNSILSAAGRLVRAAIQSPNFLHNSTGWSINKDGSAEFSNVVIRNGQIISGSVLIYSTNPGALGTLVSSDSQSGGTDAFGNAYLPGTVSYQASGGGYLASQLYNGAVFLQQNTTYGGAYTQFGEMNVGGGPSMQFALGGSTEFFFNGATVINGAVGLQSISAPAAVLLQAWLYANANGNPAAVLPSGLTGTLPVIQTDISTNTNANNGTQLLSVNWTIPAGDAQVGTVYEIEVPFNGTFETATLGFKPNLSGVTQTTSGGDTVGGAFFSAGQGFQGTVRLKMVVKTIGGAGTVDLFIDGGLGFNGNRSSGTNNNDTTLNSQSIAMAFNTTISNTLSVNSVWGASVASQTITGRGSKFTRSGP